MTATHETFITRAELPSLRTTATRLSISKPAHEAMGPMTNHTKTTRVLSTEPHWTPMMDRVPTLEKTSTTEGQESSMVTRIVMRIPNGYTETSWQG